MPCVTTAHTHTHTHIHMHKHIQLPELYVLRLPLPYLPGQLLPPAANIVRLCAWPRFPTCCCPFPGTQNPRKSTPKSFPCSKSLAHCNLLFKLVRCNELPPEKCKSSGNTKNFSQHSRDLRLKAFSVVVQRTGESERVRSGGRAAVVAAADKQRENRQLQQQRQQWIKQTLQQFQQTDSLLLSFVAVLQWAFLNV